MKIHIERLLQLLKDNADYFQDRFPEAVDAQVSTEYKLMLRNYVHHQLLEEAWREAQAKTRPATMEIKEESMDG